MKKSEILIKKLLAANENVDVAEKNMDNLSGDTNANNALWDAFYKANLDYVNARRLFDKYGRGLINDNWNPDLWDFWVRAKDAADMVKRFESIAHFEKPAAKSDVMKRAWEIAREAVAKFGGKVKAFFAEALKMAWSEAHAA